MILLLEALFSGSSLLLAFLIFINHHNVNQKATVWFGFFVFSIFLLSIDVLIPNENETLRNLIGLISFVVAPLFYLSVSYYIFPNRKWKLTDYLHFSLFFIAVLFTIATLFVDDKNREKEVPPNVVAVASIIFYVIFSIQVLIYCLLSLRKIIKHQKNVRLFSSSTENIDLKWLELISFGIITMSIFWIMDVVFDLSSKNSFFDYFSSVVYLSSIFFITYNWIKQKEIYPYNYDAKKEIDEIITETTLPEQKRKKLISDEKLHEIKMELLHLMETKKPFFDCELNLVKLANEMDLTSHILSYCLNKGFNENFYQFINRYRIEEAKKILKDNSKSNLTLVGIAFEVGFNSKTVFNTTFKKVTSLTPTEYKNKHK